MSLKFNGMEPSRRQNLSTDNAISPKPRPRPNISEAPSLNDDQKLRVSDFGNSKLWKENLKEPPTLITI